ncbi:orotate phosphoribosyltransferase [Aquimarina sp. ERC-38]|uniref:orotate phosphoribosyltransferase n=1 Tax=Aquimarina sp. ERC-38 TaxID=2949996 RepID=UPI0022453EBB|nr:orotate phosphoribosyltransferase [Aquimarina sp. ERC-38]UZO80555.1 orotate phosphoribosyltransferase [Aquimarina sp. ERC-38]
MIFNIETAKKTAELLLQIKAIKLQPQEPFTWASGWKSPIYCDNRIALSYPEVRNYIKEHLSEIIKVTYGRPDFIAGVATGAIGIGMLVADYLDLPFIYVRPEAKSHGRKNQIEGIVPKDKSVVVIEDLISTGNSSLHAVEALQKAEAVIKGMVSIFDYGFDISKENFDKAEISLYSLSDYTNLLAQTEETNYITKEQKQLLDEWRKAPSTWNI